MLSVLIKLAVLALAIKEIWLLMGIPAVSDAVLSFVMIGAIPGTNHVLSPDDILRVLPFAAAVAFALIFRTQLVQLIRRAQARKRETMAAYAHLNPQEQYAPRMPIPHPLRSAAMTRPAKVITLATMQYRIATNALGAKVHRSRIAGIGFAGMVWQHIQSFALFVWNVAMIGVVVVSQVSIQLWRWLRPHIERFDQWLRRKSNEHEVTAFILALASEMAATATGWIASVKQIVAQVTNQNNWDIKAKKP